MGDSVRRPIEIEFPRKAPGESGSSKRNSSCLSTLSVIKDGSRRHGTGESDPDSHGAHCG